MRSSKFLLVATLLTASFFPITGHAFTVIDGEVSEISGPDDLLLDPEESVIAIDSFGNADSTINGVTFFTDRAGLGAGVTAEGVVTNEGVTVTTGLVNQIDDWAAAPAFTGIDATSATNLSAVMSDIRWANAGAGQTVNVDIAGLADGVTYNVQLLFNEGADRDRRWDIAVDGVLTVDDFSSEGGDGVYTPDNSFVYAGEFDPGADGILNIVLGQEPLPVDPNNTPFSGADNNAILQGIIVHTAFGPTAPNDILLSANEIPATAAVGSLVGLLSSSDVNGGSHVYDLVAGAGDTANALFQTDGDELLTAADLSAEAGNTLSIRVRSTDDTDLSFEKALDIIITEDGDADLLPDGWELGFRPNLADLTGLKSGPGPGADSGDFDNDNSPDLDEFNIGTDPTDDDSDDDGSNDGDEATNMTDPNDEDSDDDGLNDGDEAANMTDPNNPDSDGDNLTDADEVNGTTDPNLADTDGDGLNDDVDPAPNDPDIFSNTVVFTGEVIEFKGPDDLNLDPGTAVIAVDVFGAGDSLINGVNFMADTTGTVTNGDVTVTTTAANQIPDWAVGQTYTGVDATSAANLSIVMQSIRWQGAPDPVNIDISGLTSGALYEVQLYFNEGADRARQWDIGVEDELVVDNMTSEGAEGIGVWAPDNGFAYVGEFEGPADGILNVVMQQHLGGQDPRGADNNPILQAVVVHLAAPSTPFVITGIVRDPVTGISTITWNSAPGREYALDFSPDMGEGEFGSRWTELDDGIASQGEQTSFTDLEPRLGEAGFYRVRVP